jgi:hypothetical protein
MPFAPTDMEVQARVRAFRDADPPGTLSVVFVNRDGRRHSDRASELGGRVVWHRDQGEAQEDFERRVMADVPKAKGPIMSFVIFWSADDRSLGQGIAE